MPITFFRGVQIYAWACFAGAWAQMGWVDWREQKILNRFLGFWLKLALAGYAALMLHSFLGAHGYFPVFIMRGYYQDILLHAAFSVLAAYALWWLRAWPAGDVKLFSLLAFFYPLMRIPAEFRSGTRFLEVLINTFVPAAAFLFVTAALYLWRTRFAHQKEFIVDLGVKKALPYMANMFSQALAALKLEAASWADSFRQPGQLALSATNWLASVAVMSMISYYLNDVIRSEFLKTLVCFGLFFGWSRFCSEFGKVRSLALVAGVFSLLLWRYPRFEWNGLLRVFGDISVFSLFIFFGVQIAFRVVAGQTGFVFMPLLFMLPSLIPWQRITSWLPGFGGFSLHLGPPPPGLPTVAVWAAMGLFFGLSLVFVRIWDAESFQSVPPGHIRPYMNLGPSIVAEIEADEDFRDEHFHAFYADGLTPAQVEALQEWCEEKGITEVPLAPTISFANWIFVGYLLTLVLDGHVLRWVY